MTPVSDGFSKPNPPSVLPSGERSSEEGEKKPGRFTAGLVASAHRRPGYPSAGSDQRELPPKRNRVPPLSLFLLNPNGKKAAKRPSTLKRVLVPPD